MFTVRKSNEESHTKFATACRNMARCEKKGVDGNAIEALKAMGKMWCNRTSFSFLPSLTQTVKNTADYLYEMEARMYEITP